MEERLAKILIKGKICNLQNSWTQGFVFFNLMWQFVKKKSKQDYANQRNSAFMFLIYLCWAFLLWIIFAHFRYFGSMTTFLQIVVSDDSFEIVAWDHLFKNLQTLFWTTYFENCCSGQRFILQIVVLDHFFRLSLWIIFFATFV